MLVDFQSGKKLPSYESVNLDRKIRHKKLGVMTPRQFVDALEREVSWIMDPYFYTNVAPFKDRKELREWCISNQPYYKKYIPEVVTYFALKYDIPTIARDEPEY